MKARILWVGAAVIALSAALAHAHDPMPSDKKTELSNAMRNLWEQHVWWTRLYIVSAVAALPDKDATTKRLLKNQSDLGNAIKPYFGDAAGDKLTALLKDHILIAAELVDAAKAGDKTKVTATKKKWDANADDIAAFLTAANPTDWPITATKPMMHQHLDMTVQEVTAHLEGRHADEVATFDRIEDQALMMADTLTTGIVHKFPDKFATK